MTYIEIPLPDSPLSDAIRVLPLSFENGPWVAGGSLRRILVNDFEGTFDIDIFHPMDSRPEWGHPSSFSFETRQLLYQWVTKKKYPTYDALLTDIDFTICQFATDGKTIRGSELSFRDLKNRVLRMPINRPTTSLARLVRYVLSGYVPDPSLMETFTQKITASSSTFFYDDTDAERLKDELPDACLGGDKAILGILSDVHIERFGDDIVVYLEGNPMPLSMAFTYVYASQADKNFVMREMKNKWSAMGFEATPITLPDIKKSFEQALRIFSKTLD